MDKTTSGQGVSISYKTVILCCSHEKNKYLQTLLKISLRTKTDWLPKTWIISAVDLWYIIMFLPLAINICVFLDNIPSTPWYQSPFPEFWPDTYLIKLIFWF